MLRASVTLLQRAVGSEHLRMAGALIDLGRVHAAAERLDEAEAELRRALTTLERLQGPVKEYEGEAAALLADVIQRRGKTTEADTLFERAATILRPLPQRFGYGRLAAYEALAEYYKAKRQPADEMHFRRLGRAVVTSEASPGSSERR
jgi:tetratricopeptide (TPR) repeat protein